MSDFEPLFQYRPLPQDKIRAIEIEPSQEHSTPIECRMLELTVPVHRDVRRFERDTEGPSVPYAALSYTWGAISMDGSHLTDTIYCDGEVLRVTANLNNALKRIRQSWCSIQIKSRIHQRIEQDASSPNIPFARLLPFPRLWVDAICLNQEDLEERAREVARMDWIYSHCSALLIYLGEPSGDLAPQFSLAVRQANEIGFWKPDWTSNQKPTLRFLESILDMSWFQRRWVIQEYALSPYIFRYLILGDLLIESTDLEVLISKAALSVRSGPFATSGIGGMSNIIQALFTYSSARCLNPLDRVYALMSLVDEPAKIDLTVDYSISVAELNRRVASAALTLPCSTDSDKDEIKPFEQRIHVLLAATCRHRPLSIKGPLSSEDASWIPDWSLNPSYQCDDHQRAVEDRMKYLVVGKGSLSKHMRYPVRIEGNHMILWGLLVRLCFRRLSHRDGSCISCDAFRNFKRACSGTLWRYLGDTVRDDDRLYVPTVKGDAPIYFVLRRTRELWEDTYPIYTLHYCFIGPSLPQPIETSPCAQESVKFETIVIR